MISEEGNQKKVKGVLFDMDGTMFDTETMSMFGWAAAARKYNISITKEFMISCMGLTTKVIEEMFHNEFGADFDYAGLRKDKLRIMEQLINADGVPHKEGLVEILEYIKSNNLKCAVVTSTTNKRAIFNIEKGNVFKYFDEIISGDMVENSKPEPDIYIYAAEKLGLKPQDCVVIEDSKNGILSAARSGAIAILVPDIIPLDEEMISSADYRCSNLIEVIDVIEQLNKA